MKICSDCGKSENDAEFYSKGSYCKPCHRTRQASWDAAHRQNKLDYNKGWRDRNQSRRAIMNACTNAFWRAIRQGILQRGTVCTFCGSAENIEGAHTDYGKPLEVIWLCRKCHRQWDSKEPKTLPRA